MGCTHGYIAPVAQLCGPRAQLLAARVGAVNEVRKGERHDALLRFRLRQRGSWLGRSHGSADVSCAWQSRGCAGASEPSLKWARVVVAATAAGLVPIGQTTPPGTARVRTLEIVDQSAEPRSRLVHRAAQPIVGSPPGARGSAAPSTDGSVRSWVGCFDGKNPQLVCQSQARWDGSSAIARDDGFAELTG